MSATRYCASIAAVAVNLVDVAILPTVTRLVHYPLVALSRSRCGDDAADLITPAVIPRLHFARSV